MQQSTSLPGLNVPERQPQTRGSFDTRPKKVEQWVADLPGANVGQTARLVFGALTETNALDVNPEERLQFLESLGPTVRHLGVALKKHYLGRTFPLSEKERQVATLEQAIHEQMATGYKIIVADVNATRRWLRNPKYMGLALHRAISHLSRILLNVYQIYAPARHGIWRELHTLYAMAEQLDALSKSVSHDGYTGIEESTIADAYKQAMLLSLADPYRLRQGEVEVVYAALELWSAEGRIFRSEDPQGIRAKFLVDLGGDEPPVFRGTPGHTMTATTRLLEAPELSRILREKLQQGVSSTTVRLQAANGSVAATMSRDLLQRLILSWGMLAQREFSRTEQSGQVLVAMGLRAVHHFLLESAAHSAAEDGSATQAPRGVEQPTQMSKFKVDTKDRSQIKTSPDVWKLFRPAEEFEAPSWSVGDTPNFDGEAAQETAAAAAARFAAHPWDIDNISAGGYCLRWNRTTPSNAQVGELVGLQELGSPETCHWGIGVIRRMKHLANDGLEIGVQLLAPTATPVAARVRNDNGEWSDRLRALLLPAIRATQHPATLVTPRVPFKVGSRIKLDERNHKAQVELTASVMSTGAFAQFEFQDIGHLDQVAPGEPQPKDNEGFDGLWSRL
jgi:hypothetical protein